MDRPGPLPIGAERDRIPEPLLSRGEAARYLGVHTQLVYEWAKAGRIPYRTTLGGHFRFDRADLDAVHVKRRRARPELHA